jgi:hypothetical protein
MTWVYWRWRGQDAAIIYFLTFLGGFALGLFGITLDHEHAAVYQAETMVMSIAGYCILGCLRRNPLDLINVAFVVWLMSVSNVLLGHTSLSGWVVGFVGVAVQMLIGAALSYLLIRVSFPLNEATRMAR